MNKYHAIKMMRNNGDSTIVLAGENPIVATIDFDNKYIRRIRHGRYSIIKNSILLFSWTDYKSRNILIESIKSIRPLSETLNNLRSEEM